MLKIKKILLIIAITLCIFQLVVLATAIDIGESASDRGSSDADYTDINVGNPANESGTITSIEIWANTNLDAGVEVATFFLVSGTNFSTRDSVTLGNVTAGSKQTFTEDSDTNPIALEVEAGDYIGVYFSDGAIEYDSSGFSGVWAVSGDKIPCTNQEFTLYGGDAVSVYATGATAEEGGTSIMFTFSSF